MAGRNTSPTSVSSAESNIVVQPALVDSSRSSISASPPHSTPPTSLGDDTSVRSDAAKMDSLVESLGDPPVSQAHTGAQSTPQPAAADTPESDGKRSIRSSRAKVTTYNVQMLAGTAIHTPTKYLKRHHKNVLHGKLEDVIKVHNVISPKKRRSRFAPEDSDDPVEQQLAAETAQAARRRRSSRAVDLRKEALRNLSAVGEVASSVAQKGSALLFGGKNKVQPALRRTRSESSLALAKASSSRPRVADYAESNSESEDDEEKEDSEKEYVKPKTKKWLQQGLYVGQHREFDARLSETQNRIRRKSTKAKESRVLPLPMFAGERMLNNDDPRRGFRDFKLPFDTYNPLPRKVKVDGWVKLHKNRFIGEASALWKRDKQDSSQCYCLPEDGCGEACHNRIMAYECDSNNCRLTPEQCGNRPFAELKKRAKGNGYDYGVEVMETGGKGYGVRAMRCFDPHQIIVEYAGEIITQDECEDRMKKIYKKDKCYYLMSFDNKMIIDATRGTIARFVNHSCEPNCEMIKWTVGNEPRMALFAGSRGIMTGEELTYDYNFDPFSSKNIQECRCGTRSCRGVLGPKPKYQNPNLASSLLAGTKRKIQEVFGMKGSESPYNSPKKRKFAMASSTSTKAQNALAEASAAREKVKKDAADHAAQIASRKNRAMKRSASMTLSSRRSKLLRKTTRRSLPILKSSRKTTVSIKRRTPKALPPPSAYKQVNNLAGYNAMRAKAKKEKEAKATKPRHSLPAKIPRTPKATVTNAESESEDESPNITPASLRSATRAASGKKMTQSKLPFKPLNFGSISESVDSDDEMEVRDSDDDFEDEDESPPPVKRPRGRPKAVDSLRRTGAGIKKTANRSVRGTKRAAGVVRGLRQTASSSNLRMLAGDD